MSIEERTGVRDLTYSLAHRDPKNLPEWCAMIDFDGAEYCKRCSAIIALVETAIGCKSGKPTTVLQCASRSWDIPAHLFLFDELNRLKFDPGHVHEGLNYCHVCGRRIGMKDLVGEVRMRQVGPIYGEEISIPVEAMWGVIRSWHENHECSPKDREILRKARESWRWVR